MNPILNSPIQFVHPIQSRSPTQAKMLFCLVFLLSLSTVGCAPVWNIPGTEKLGQVGNHFMTWFYPLRFWRLYKKKHFYAKRVGCDYVVCQLTDHSSLSCESVVSCEFVSRVRHSSRVCLASPSFLASLSCESVTWHWDVSLSCKCVTYLRLVSVPRDTPRNLLREFNVLWRRPMV